MKKRSTKTTSTSFCTLLLVTCLLFISSTLWGQKCKPDYSQLDKIEKKQVDVWSAELYETSFGASLTKTSTVGITFSIGRQDTLNFVHLTLQKQEESVQNALFESSLKAAKGNEFYFGLKDGDPLKFIAVEVSNKTQTKTIGLTAKLITTVTLTSEIKSEDFQKIKDALTGKNIDAIRVKLEGDFVIDQNVKEKKGDKAKEKSVCFFSFLEEKGYVK